MSYSEKLKEWDTKYQAGDHMFRMFTCGLAESRNQDIKLQGMEPEVFQVGQTRRLQVASALLRSLIDLSLNL